MDQWCGEPTAKLTLPIEDCNISITYLFLFFVFHFFLRIFCISLCRCLTNLYLTGSMFFLIYKSLYLSCTFYALMFINKIDCNILNISILEICTAIFMICLSNLIYFILYHGCFACMHVHVSLACLVSAETRRMCPVSWDWNCWLVWPALWVSGIWTGVLQ